MASNESKTLWVAVLALLAFAGMMVWMLSGPGEEGPAEDEVAMATAPATAAAPPAPKPIEAAPAAKPTATPEAVPAAPLDPLVDVFAGQMPDFMVEIHTRVLDKRPLDVVAQKKLYDFGQEHKDDARPQLLLAWDSMNREWDGIGVRMYRIAYRADARAKHDPRMLSDLISVASRFDRVEFRESSTLIVDAYGASARPRIQDEIATLRQSGQHAQAARLDRVLELIAKGPAPTPPPTAAPPPTK